MRRGPFVVVLVLVLGAGLGALALGLRARSAPRSILLVTVDTLRADFTGPLGRTPSPTPFLDGLAKEGAVFEDVWTVAPLTVPAHATFLTGLLPPLHGLRSNEPRTVLPARADRPWTTLAEAASDAGLRTAAFVSASVLRNDRTGLAAGFSRYDDVPAAKPGSLVETERPGLETVDRAVAWLREGEQPFFAWVHLWDPHYPYDAPMPFGAGAAHRGDAQGYEAEVRYADHCIGRLLDAVAGRDVVVAVVADHGEALGEHGEATHGFLLHEATLRVPLVLRAHGSIPPGTRIAEPRSVTELAPTLLAVARLPVPVGMRRETLLDARERPPLYAESFYGNDVHGWAQCAALRQGTWKLVDCGEELREYDLAADPRELRPALLDPAAPSDSPARPLPLVDALELLHGIAAAKPAAEGSPATENPTGGNYIGGSGAAGGFDPVANRRRPSPYARIDDEALLRTAQTLLVNGAPGPALAAFEQLERRAPADPQAPFWRGKALLAAKRPDAAAAAFRKAFESGFRDVRCVEMALVASVQSNDPAEGDRALSFLAEARGKGVGDSTMTSLCESDLAQRRGDLPASDAALDRARRLARTPEDHDRVRRAEADRRARGPGGGR